MQINKISTSSQTKKYFFIFSLLGLTLSALISIAIFPSFFRPSVSNPHISWLVLGWLSTAHVATSGFFYIDKDFSSLIKSKPNRYVLFPILTISICMLLWGITPKVYHSYLWVIFTGWLFWHYQKQNYGLTALISKITNSDRLTSNEYNAIMALSIGSAIAIARFKAGELDLAFLSKGNLYNLGLYIYLSALIYCCYCIYVRLRNNLKRNMYSSMFIFMSIIFFAPAFLLDSFFPAIMSYAVAHALQYWFMMTILVMNSKKENGALRSILGFIMVVILIYGAIWIGRNPNFSPTIVNYIFGMQMGITAAHFIIDADAWKLSENKQRNYILKRYSFLFSPPSSK
jgi:hypothetical protein